MPTNKPKIQAVIEQEYFDKFKSIAEKEERTISQLAKIIIKQFIDENEKKEKEKK